MNKINGIINSIEKVFLIIAGVLLIIMMFLTSADVIGRKFFATPIPGTLEFMEEIGMITVVFLTMSFVYSVGGHVRVELFERYINPKLLKSIGYFNTLISIGIFVVLAYASWTAVLELTKFHTLTNSVWRYPLAPSYAMVTVGSLMMIVRTVQDFMLKIQGKSLVDLSNKKIMQATDEMVVVDEYYDRTEEGEEK